MTQIKEGLEKGVRECAVISFSEVRKETFLKSSEVAVRLLHCPAPSRINIELQK